MDVITKNSLDNNNDHDKLRSDIKAHWFSNLLRQARSALILFGILTLLTGVLYPLLITGIAQLALPWQANGSLLVENNQIIGSALIGQHFSDPGYFWSRPSSTAPVPYNAAASSGSNYGPTNPLYWNTVKIRIAELNAADPENTLTIPVDLVTASGSGLDPDISPYAAFYQAHRIAKARQLPEASIQALITALTQPRFGYILGESRVNVLQLNRALDAQYGNIDQRSADHHANSTP